MAVGLARSDPALPEVADTSRTIAFEQLLDSWYPLTYMLNNLNRGLPDAYPFVLSTPAIDKSRFVHDVIDRYTPWGTARRP